MVIHGRLWVPMGYLVSKWWLTHGVVDLSGTSEGYVTRDSKPGAW